MQYYRNSRPFSWGGLLQSLIITALVIAAIYYIFTGAFWLLKVAAPVLFILTLIFNYKVVLNFARSIGSLIERSPLIGIIAAILSVVLFPFTIFMLFLRSLRPKRPESEQFDAGATFNPFGNIRNNSKVAEDEYVSYEEVIEDFDKPKAAAEPVIIEVPKDIKQPNTKQKPQGDAYDQLFEI